MWNGKDPFLKERLFGVTGPEGNHGEDVKEEYFYLRSSPTHSYMKGLYKYPMAEFPYDTLKSESKSRTRLEREFELVRCFIANVFITLTNPSKLDTGVFDSSEYWDVQVEYGKSSPNHLLIRITLSNRSDHEETLHFLPTLWVRL